MLRRRYLLKPTIAFLIFKIKIYEGEKRFYLTKEFFRLKMKMGSPESRKFMEKSSHFLVWVSLITSICVPKSSLGKTISDKDNKLI